MKRNESVHMTNTGRIDDLGIHAEGELKTVNSTNKKPTIPNRVVQNAANINPVAKKALKCIGGVVLMSGCVVGIYLGVKTISHEFAWRNSLISDLQGRIADLESLCETKDRFFSEMISDGLRHRSALAAQHMADRKYYLQKVG